MAPLHEQVRDYLKDIPGFYTIGIKSPLDDLVVYVHTEKDKKQAEERLAKKNFSVSVEVCIMRGKFTLE